MIASTVYVVVLFFVADLIAQLGMVMNMVNTSWLFLVCMKYFVLV